MNINDSFWRWMSSQEAMHDVPTFRLMEDMNFSVSFFQEGGIIEKKLIEFIDQGETSDVYLGEDNRVYIFQHDLSDISKHVLSEFVKINKSFLLPQIEYLGEANHKGNSFLLYRMPLYEIPSSRRAKRPYSRLLSALEDSPSASEQSKLLQGVYFDDSSEEEIYLGKLLEDLLLFARKHGKAELDLVSENLGSMGEQLILVDPLRILKGIEDL